MWCLENLSQIVTLDAAHSKDGRNLKPEDLSIRPNCSIVFDEHRILWIGNIIQIPDDYKKAKRIPLEGHVLTPEIVDSHTHLVFGGNRSKEYSMRLNGADYEAIAKAGGGILSTMESTITATEEELYKAGLERIERMASYGIGTIEIKSGYGLSIESERKISRVIHKLKEYFSPRIQILSTYLAAHAVPGSFSTSKDYLDRVVLPLMQELSDEKIIDFVDIFHEQGYFNLEDTKTLFSKAKILGLKLKIHADEFNDNKGAVTACEHQALSADHLLCTEDDGIKALSQASTVATLLPGTAFFLGKKLANARRFLDEGCKVAIASDYNPGSCHCDNLVLLASLSAKKLELNLCELWSGMTLNAAHAVGLDQQGAIKLGLKPRFSLFKCQSIDEVTYNWGRNLAVSTQEYFPAH
ncbi:MAG: imidazolonepropionase [Halobacteriovoraceae bacterium]|nr:imidazolonepropionase [Halobacteriovoraceae bacterium]|tara:strand:- start:7021 stop:8253 length:1233 start_codon:yes stop_codon:yes gene_type:complete